MLKKKDIEAEIATLSHLERMNSLTREEQIGLWVLKNVFQLVKDIPEIEEKISDKKADVKWSYFTQPNVEIPQQTNPFRTERVRQMVNDFATTGAPFGVAPTPPTPTLDRVSETWDADEYDDAMLRETFRRRNPLVTDSFLQIDEGGRERLFYEVILNAE